MIGIDFGTSNTVVTRRTSTGIEMVRLSSESYSVPTLLFVDQSGGVQIGHDARQSYAEASHWSGSGAAPFRLFQALKLALKDPSLESTNVFGKRVPLEQVVAWYLAVLRQRLEAEVPTWDRRAVIGRPAELAPDLETDRLIQERFARAFALAGFDEVHFVAEPVAAAVDLVGQQNGFVLVFDFGGGTLDVSIAEIEGDSIRILTSVGRDLGGYLIDEDMARARIQQHFGYGGRLRTLAGQNLEVPHEITGQVVQFKVLPFDETRRIKRLIPELIQEAVQKAPLRGLLSFLDQNLTYDLYHELDQAKIRLSDELHSEVNFQVPPHVSIHEVFLRSEFNSLVAPRVAEAEQLIQRALESARLATSDIQHVIRVGGSSQIPAFEALLDRTFPGKLSTGRLFDGIALGLVPAWERGLAFPALRSV